MEKPSLKEIKEYFNNAETVKCLSDGDTYKIDLSQIIEESDTRIYIYTDSENTDSCCLFSKPKGYAKILTYKNTEPKFEITKEQIFKLSGINCVNKEHLNEWFPEVFETVLCKNYTGWVLDEKYPKVIAYSEKGYLKYGFNANGKWIENTCTKLRKERKATTEEVTEAFKNESVKRYNKTYCLTCLHHGTYSKIDLEYKTALCEKGFWYGGKCVMKDGKWAEIIPTKTIQEAEELLKELGHNFKIV